MGNKFNNNIPKDVKLAISFEGELIKLYLRNRLDKWINIGVASETFANSAPSKTQREILSLTDSSTSLVQNSENSFESLEDLSNQVKVLSEEVPMVEVWLPDELILCQTLLQKNKLNNLEATEIVAKTCKLEPEDLCLVLSPHYRERSQKISAVTFEAIDKIRSYLKSYGIIATKFKASNPQPGFDYLPTFYEDKEIDFEPSLISRVSQRIPEIVALFLVIITLGKIISERSFSTQTSVRTLAGLEEEGNFSLKNPRALDLLSEATFPYFAPTLHKTKEQKTFRLISYDIGSKKRPPLLRQDLTKEKFVSVKLGSAEIEDSFALLVLKVKNSWLSRTSHTFTEKIELDAKENHKPETISLTLLDPPRNPTVFNNLYQKNHLEVELYFEVPEINILDSQENNFKVHNIYRPSLTNSPSNFATLSTLDDTLPTNYNSPSPIQANLLLPLKLELVMVPIINGPPNTEGPNISGHKLTKLNINPARLNQPNLLIDKIFQNGELREIITQVPTSASEIEYVLLNKSKEFLPGRPDIRVRLKLEQPTLSSGALAFSHYPLSRPENINTIAKSIRSKKRIKAKATVGPRIPKRTFAPAMATLSNRLELDRTNLLGVFGSKNKPYALIMLSNGEMLKLSIGDQFLGWRVYGIDQTAVHVQNGKNQEILRIPG
ncbi:MAG: hypothetical protein ACJZ8A_02430 [Paracoccaceae bacterium]